MLVKGLGSKSVLNDLNDFELRTFKWFCKFYLGQKVLKGNLAEWSKAPVSGAGPKGREFESLSYHFLFYYFNGKSIAALINLTKCEFIQWS